MNITLRTFYHINSLKDFWISLQESNESLSPFQYYDYNYNLFVYQWWKMALPSRSIPMFIVAFHDSQPCVIAPLMKSLSTGEYRLLGDMWGSDMADFIYSLKTEMHILQKCLKEIINKCGTINIARLNPESPLLELFRHVHPETPLGTFVHVNIPFGESHQTYFESLSKNARQNLRTSYNRLSKDGKSHRLLIHSLSATNKAESINRMACDHPVSNSKMWKDISDIYHQRQRDAYGYTNPLQKLYLRWLKHDSISLRKNSNAVYAILYIDEEIAAEMLGFVNQKKDRFVVPRLAINSKFKFYSPGNILINEYIKECIANSTIRNLDLSRGSEKYKYVMGGGNTSPIASNL